ARARSRSSRSAAPTSRPTRWRGSSAGRRATRRPPRIWSRATCWSTPCAAAPRRGRGSARTSSTCRPRSVPHTRRSIPRTIRGSGSAKPALGGEDRRELERRSDVELVVAAVRRPLVRPPADERRGVAEAVPLQVIVLHLADALDAERLPRKILAGAPPTL